MFPETVMTEKLQEHTRLLKAKTEMRSPLLKKVSISKLNSPISSDSQKRTALRSLLHSSGKEERLITGLA